MSELYTSFFISGGNQPPPPMYMTNELYLKCLYQSSTQSSEFKLGAMCKMKSLEN